MEPVPNRAPKYATSADYKRALSNKSAGEKRHSHKFNIGDADVYGPDPESTETYIPCNVEGCTAELRADGENVLLHHEGKVSTFKGKIEVN